MITFIKNVGKFILIAFFISLAFYFSLLNLKTGAYIGVIFAIFYTLVLYGNKLELVDVFGAKFKLKELNNSINELKELSKAVACISLDLIQRSNRFYDNDYERIKIDFFNTIDKILKNVNIPDSEKNEIYDKYWHNWVLNDYADIIYKNIKNFINNSSLPEEDKKSILSLYHSQCYSSIIEAHEVALQKGIKFNADITNQMDDFKYYTVNKRHKSIEDWLKLNK